MKKIIIALLALVLTFSMVACDNGTTEESTPATSETVSTEASAEESAEAPKSDIGSALEVLETVWTDLSDDYKFYCIGGDIAAGNAVENAPADFGVTDAESVDNSLGFPAADIALIDQAANLIHGMNANTLTMASYHMADASKLDDAVKAIEDNISNRQWMCGFPEELVIITIDGEYIVTMFGALDLVNALQDQVTTSYSSAVLALEKNLME